MRDSWAIPPSLSSCALHAVLVGLLLSGMGLSSVQADNVLVPPAAKHFSHRMAGRPEAAGAPGTAPTAIPLVRPGASPGSTPVQDGWGRSVWTTAIVLGGICAVLLAVSLSLRGRRRQTGGVLPSEAVEVLGRSRLDARVTLTLVRCGARVLVLGTDLGGGVTILSEISDPNEVNLLLDACRLPPGGLVEALGDRVSSGRVSAEQRVSEAALQESTHA